MNAVENVPSYVRLLFHTVLFLDDDELLLVLKPNAFCPELSHALSKLLERVLGDGFEGRGKGGFAVEEEGEGGDARADEGHGVRQVEGALQCDFADEVREVAVRA